MEKEKSEAIKSFDLYIATKETKSDHSMEEGEVRDESCYTTKASVQVLKVEKHPATPVPANPMFVHGHDTSLATDRDLQLL